MTFRTASFAATAAAVALAAAAYTFAPTEEIVTEIYLPGAPDAAWAVLTDAQAYGEWNPFIVSMEGQVVAGGVLTNQISSNGGEAVTFSPEILVAEPGRELRWLGGFILPGVFDGEHYFIFKQDGEGTRMIHGERFSGVAFWFLEAEAFRSDFERMNDALSARMTQLAAAGSSS